MTKEEFIEVLTKLNAYQIRRIKEKIEALTSAESSESAKPSDQN